MWGHSRSWEVTWSDVRGFGVLGIKVQALGFSSVVFHSRRISEVSLGLWIQKFVMTYSHERQEGMQCVGESPT